MTTANLYRAAIALGVETEEEPMSIQPPRTAQQIIHMHSDRELVQELEASSIICRGSGELASERRARIRLLCVEIKRRGLTPSQVTALRCTSGKLSDAQ